jgi:hypothetical protein
MSGIKLRFQQKGDGITSIAFLFLRELEEKAIGFNSEVVL